MQCGWQCVATDETGRGGKAEDQKDKLGPIVNQITITVNHLWSIYSVTGTVLMLCKHFFEPFQ